MAKVISRKISRWLLLLLLFTLGATLYIFFTQDKKSVPLPIAEPIKKEQPKVIKKKSPVVITKKIKAPLAPTELIATDGDREKITIIWSRVEDAQSYTIYRSLQRVGGYTPIAKRITKDLYIDTNVTSNITYYYKVLAVNEGGKSKLSDSESGLASLPDIEAFSVDSSELQKKIRLSWRGDFDSYTLYRSLNAKSGYEPIASDVRTTSFTDRNITPCSDYYYRIQGRKSGAVNALSPWADGHTSCPILVSDFAGTMDQGFKDADNPKASSFNRPSGLAFREDLLFIADSYNHAIRSIDKEGQTKTFAKRDLKVKKQSSSFYHPTGIAVDSKGNIYVTEVDNHLVRKISPSGSIEIFAGNGQAGDQDGQGIKARLNHPYGIFIDKKDDIYITEFGNHKIKKISPSGWVKTFAGDGKSGRRDGTLLFARFDHPSAIVMDSHGRIFISDSNNHNIRMITRKGEVKTFAGVGKPGDMDAQGVKAMFNDPRAMTITFNDVIILADTGNHKIRLISPSGNVHTLKSMAKKSDTKGSIRFFSPRGVAINKRNELYISDFHTHTLKKVDLTKILHLQSML